jgi:hypothetical protein
MQHTTMALSGEDHRAGHRGRHLLPGRAPSALGSLTVDMIFPGASPLDTNPLAHCDFIITVFAGFSDLVGCCITQEASASGAGKTFLLHLC